MRLFLDSHSAKLDKKGRVSLPASFRTALAQVESSSFYLRPHHLFPCIEGFSEPGLTALASSVGALDAYSEEAEMMALALMGDTTPLACDLEGRFSPPSRLIQHANIEEALVFVGLGQSFQIWEPEALEARKREAMALLREKRLSLPRPAASSVGAT